MGDRKTMQEEIAEAKEAVRLLEKARGVIANSGLLKHYHWSRNSAMCLDLAKMGQDVSCAVQCYGDGRVMRAPNTADPQAPRREQVVHSRIWGTVRLLTERLNQRGYFPHIFDPAKKRWRYVSGGKVWR